MEFRTTLVLVVVVSIVFQQKLSDSGASLTVSKYVPIDFLFVKEKDALKGYFIFFLFSLLFSVLFFHMIQLWNFDYHNHIFEEAKKLVCSIPCFLSAYNFLMFQWNLNETMYFIGLRIHSTLALCSFDLLSGS